MGAFRPFNYTLKNTGKAEQVFDTEEQYAEVLITADADNAADIKIGNESAKDLFYPLPAGKSTSFPLRYLKDLYLAGTAADKVTGLVSTELQKDVKVVNCGCNH